MLQNAALIVAQHLAGTVHCIHAQVCRQNCEIHRQRVPDLSTSAVRLLHKGTLYQVYDIFYLLSGQKMEKDYTFNRRTRTSKKLVRLRFAG